MNLNLKQLRESRGLSQKELAKRLSVNQSAVSKWETGDGTPTYKNLIKLTVALNCTISELTKETTSSK